MAISFNPDTREFHLYNDVISYILCIYENGYAGHLYFGAKLSPQVSYRHLYQFKFEGFANSGGDFARFEYPSYGNGDYRLPAVSIVQEDGSSVIDPVYRTHRIFKGKKAIPSLPATYVENDSEADTLEIDIEDKKSGTLITLSYTIFRDHAAIARHVRITNENTATIRIACAMSASIDVSDSDWNLLTLTGAWARECGVTMRPLAQGFQGVASKRGISGHQQNPFIALVRPNNDEHTGEAIGFSLVYSGNFFAGCEVDAFGVSRVRLGINPDGFEWHLTSGSSFNTPEAILVWSDTGLTGISDAYHGLYRSRLARGYWRDKPRPVLINNWEGTYFDFDEVKILDIATRAKDLGIELFVLDDGWFGNRNDDTTSLGDWFVNLKKLPGGIEGLAKKINNLGLDFGIWMEPEMISEKSELFSKHPDWAIGIPGRPRTEGRHQYVLDFSRAEIVEYLFKVFYELFSSANISYVKWDMNRSLTEPFSLSLPAQRQGEFFHRYVLGVYVLYERLLAAFPKILFESCAGGGGRFDAGMLFYAPQAWTSDNSDAMERLKIQWGASICYPLNSMGAHVSAVPNHQTGRSTPLETRAAVAFFGIFGYELDPAQLTDAEQKTIVEQVAFYKKYRSVFQQGRFIRLKSPYLGNEVAWMVVSPDKKHAIVGFYRILAQPSAGLSRLQLKGLLADVAYRVSTWPAKRGDASERGDAAEINNTGTRGGDELMNVGLLLGGDPWYTPKHGDFWSRIFVLEV